MRRDFRVKLKRSLQLLLQPLSFRQRNFTWNRVSGDFVDVVDVQWSSLDTQEGYSFTVNVGVVWPPAFEVMWQKPLSVFVDTASCTVRARIGQLIDGKDVWWESSSLSDDEMLRDARDKLAAFGLPFIERMHSMPQMEEFLGRRERDLRYPPEAIALSMIRKRLGHPDAARRVLTAAVTRGPVSAWTARLLQLLEQLDDPMDSPGRPRSIS